ncbi:CatA-like O-acetyltransferase [Pleionea sediminis]|uniref:CatA-like O-acetyltransferase n=1 Tax=Pleionea sediminis TaxID=2569479 RepID=UPI001184E70B|nr:CatA-like O-acetyltransferase [Pleionea sediminis]
MRPEKTTLASIDLTPIDREQLCNYELWAQDFFTDTNAIENPYLDITLQLDITQARLCYEAQSIGTFTAYLYFHLIQALKKHPEFFYRKINNQWMKVENPPLFYPIARGSKRDRFYEALIPNVLQLSWPEFTQLYQTEIENSKLNTNLIGNELYTYTLFIGNLPNLPFTGLTMHVNDRISCQPFFYFGQRQTIGNQLFVSLCIKFHHSCVDPYIIDLLIKDFQRQFED